MSLIRVDLSSLICLISEASLRECLRLSFKLLNELWTCALVRSFIFNLISKYLGNTKPSRHLQRPVERLTIDDPQCVSGFDRYMLETSSASTIDGLSAALSM